MKINTGDKSRHNNLLNSIQTVQFSTQNVKLHIRFVRKSLSNYIKNDRRTSRRLNDSVNINSDAKIRQHIKNSSKISRQQYFTLFDINKVQH